MGERVIESCATKLKPYLVQAVKSLGISVDDYSSVLASICQDTSDDLEKNDTCVTSEHVVSFLLVFCQLMSETFHDEKVHEIFFLSFFDFFQEDKSDSAKQSLEESTHVCPHFNAPVFFIFF